MARPGRETLDPALPLLAMAALHSIASGTARPLAEALTMMTVSSRSTRSWPSLPKPDAVQVARAALKSQGLAPLAAKLPDVEMLPPELRRLLSMELEDERTAAAALVRLMTQTVSRFRADGYEVVVFGEMAAALTVYREAALRPARRVDLLLVQKVDAGRARRALGPGSPVTVHERITTRTFRGAIDLTGRTLDDPVARAVEGVQVLFPSPSALAAQLLWAAAADFADDGLPGISAIDFRLLSLAGGQPTSDSSSIPEGSSEFLIPVVDAVERFCPGAFDQGFVMQLSKTVLATRRELARSIPPLRGTRSAGSTLLPKDLIENPLRRLVFVLARNLQRQNRVQSR